MAAVGDGARRGILAVKSADAHLAHVKREGGLRRRHTRLQHRETVITDEA